MPELDCAESTPSANPRFLSEEPPQEWAHHAGHRAFEVSVCIVNWNCCEMLRACLRSLLLDQDTPLEIIVVDNASTDGAADMVASEFPGVHLIRNRVNAGFSRANNQAASAARGRYLFFLNNDTLVPPKALTKLRDFLERHDEVILVGPKLRDGDGKTRISYRRRPTVATFLHRTVLFRWTGLFYAAYRSYRRMEAFSAVAQRVDVLQGAALMIRRDRFLELGGWDDDFSFGGEDLDLCCRANERGSVVYLPQVEITHYGRESTRQHIGFAWTQIAIGFVRYFRKSGASRPALWAYKLAMTIDVPMQIVGRGSQLLLFTLLGKKKKAEGCWTALRGLVPFLWRGLVPFWRA
ncbi:MAG: glycosyltransferase family 2 protein [Planctomycetes bacterium]|nr:glycosyltransferase family 2 protein [Planctomycetota bacterium]